MSVEEKIDYVQSLWDRIAVDESQIPVSDWHRELLNERLADYRANPNEGRPWEEVEVAGRRLGEHVSRARTRANGPSSRPLAFVYP